MANAPTEQVMQVPGFENSFLFLARKEYRVAVLSLAEYEIGLAWVRIRLSFFIDWVQKNEVGCASVFKAESLSQHGVYLNLR